jgi:hypothetical protein
LIKYEKLQNRPIKTKPCCTKMSKFLKKAQNYVKVKITPIRPTVPYDMRLLKIIYRSLHTFVICFFRYHLIKFSIWRKYFFHNLTIILVYEIVEGQVLEWSWAILKSLIFFFINGKLKIILDEISKNEFKSEPISGGVQTESQ